MFRVNMPVNKNINLSRREAAGCMIKTGTAHFFKLSLVIEFCGEILPSHDQILSLGQQGGDRELLGPGREREEMQYL